MTDTPLPPGLSNDELDELDQILTDLGQRVEEIPQWEFCDGFLTALVCMRRRVEPAEYLPMLLDDGAVLEVAADAPLPLLPAFQDAAQQARFLELWQRRWDEVAHQLAAEHPKMIAVTNQGFSTEVGGQQMPHEGREHVQ